MALGRVEVGEMEGGEGEDAAEEVRVREAQLGEGELHGVGVARRSEGFLGAGCPVEEEL